MYNSISNSNYNVKKDNNWSYLLFKTKFWFLPSPQPTPQPKFCLNTNIPDYIYNRFHVNCYLKATCKLGGYSNWGIESLRLDAVICITSKSESSSPKNSESSLAIVLNNSLKR